MYSITVVPRKIRSLFSLLVLLTLLLEPSQVGAVVYEVRFDALWSSTLHPGAYPAGAHFSPLIGVTHNDQVSFWESGGMASPGMEVMAETGGTSPLRSEFEAAEDDMNSLIFVSGPDSPGTSTATFEIVPSYSLVTLVTMIAPSPDWFIGVTSLDLRSDGAWLPEVTVDLFAYDAGTDSGEDFTSSNANTTPPDPITMLGEPLAGLPAMGTFTFTLLLPGDFDDDGDVDGYDFLEWQRGESTNPLSPSDLADWQADFGAVSTLSATSTAVPEPSTGLALLFGLIAIQFRRAVAP